MLSQWRNGALEISPGVAGIAEPGLTCVMLVSGNETSIGLPGWRPKNSGGVTPMIVKEELLMKTLRPTTAGSSAKRLRQ
jgi:hypothetical protein